MRAIDLTQRRSRLAGRHLLAPGAAASSVSDVAAAMVGLHSSDPATVFLSVRARMDAVSIDDIQDALYEARSLVRIVGMRRTLWVVPRRHVPLLQSGFADALALGERRRNVSLLEAQGVTDDGEAWMRAAEEATMASLEERGEAAAAELSADVPALLEKLTFGEGTKWEGQVGMSTRVLFQLATGGRIVRTRPRGSWISGQYRWAPMERWLGVPVDGRDPAQARAELTGRWLRAFGPATLRDVKWWTGLTVAQTKAALEAVQAVEVGVPGGSAFVHPEDVEVVAPPPPWAAFLPGLDPTTMGWADREWYLGDHREQLFDRNGNAGPTVWWDGRVVGGWAQSDGGRVVYRLLEDIGSDAVSAIETEAHGVETWLGGTRVTPRFRTPLERTLSAGEPQ